jgi:hypothetical protein
MDLRPILPTVGHVLWQLSGAGTNLCDFFVWLRRQQASDILYDNSKTGFPALDVQSAIDHLNYLLKVPLDGKIYGRRDNKWAVAEYTHIQEDPSDCWLIQHNLGRHISKVLTVNSSGEEIIGERDLSLSTLNLLVIRFSEPLDGIAYM